MSLDKGKQDSAQLELFSQGKQALKLKNESPRPLFSYIRHYEKAVLVFIGFIITGIISFSLGVEQGKKVAMLKVNSQIETASGKEAPIRAQAARYDYTVPAKNYTEASRIPPPEVAPKAKGPAGSYTIQLASYRAANLAQKELEKLRKNGLSPLLISKAGYTVLCVGNFSHKSSATSLLAELRKRYRDCLLRRL